MFEVRAVRSVAELVATSVSDTSRMAETLNSGVDTPAMAAYADLGVSWVFGACHSESGLRDAAAYRARVAETANAAWMDNTTLVTAATLMSDRGPEALTPLTVWDLATLARSVVCYEHIYHHAHPGVDDAELNRRLGDEVFIAVPLPLQPASARRILPERWEGAHRLMCDVWRTAYSWLRRLYEAADSNTLDGRQLQAVTEAWRHALGCDDLWPRDLVNFRDVDRRWQSPSDRLLLDTADITTVSETLGYLDPDEGASHYSRLARKLGTHDPSIKRRAQLLSDLNLRSYVNQRLAEFFQLPYACSAARSPFRNHLYDQALRIQQQLTLARVIDDRYAELAKASRLRLPVFLSLAVSEAREPVDVWAVLASMRHDARTLRRYRGEVDRALERGDLKEAVVISKALHTTVDSVLAVAGMATVSAGAVVVEELAKGDLPSVSTGIAATVAAAKGLVKSSLAQRLLWRLRRPYLLWVNDLVDQAHRLTEALPDFSRIWQLAPNQQAEFARRFQRMAGLAGHTRAAEELSAGSHA